MNNEFKAPIDYDLLLRYAEGNDEFRRAVEVVHPVFGQIAKALGADKKATDDKLAKAKFDGETDYLKRMLQQMSEKNGIDTLVLTYGGKEIKIGIIDLEQYDVRRRPDRA